VLREYPDETYLQFGLDRSLAGAMVNTAGVPAVTLEVGPRRHLLASAVEVAFRATLGVLGAAGIVDHVEPPHSSAVPGAWRRAPTPRTRRGGLAERLVAPGTRVRRGDLLARLVGLTGEVVEEVPAVEDALVVSWVEGAWVAPGGLLGTLGIPDDSRL
jgi:predicted deacylase